jgi:hypothetical protein
MSGGGAQRPVAMAFLSLASPPYTQHFEKNFFFKGTGPPARLVLHEGGIIG